MFFFLELLGKFLPDHPESLFLATALVLMIFHNDCLHYTNYFTAKLVTIKHTHAPGGMGESKWQREAQRQMSSSPERCRKEKKVQVEKGDEKIILKTIKN